VDNYTITVTGPTVQELTSQGTTATITVVYNEMHTVNIKTNNCAGSSSDSATADIFEGKDQLSLRVWGHTLISEHNVSPRL